MDACIQHAFEAFHIAGELTKVEELTSGNVHRTYRLDVKTADGTAVRYVMQKMNTYAFRKPTQVMENIDRVTRHLQRKYPDQEGLRFEHTADGNAWFEDESGFWRICNFIDGITYNRCTDAEVLRGAGAAFGAFQNQLSDFPASELYETIPDFHNTIKRFSDFEAAVRADSEHRLCEVQAEVEQMLRLKDKACTLTRILQEGKLPVRVTHNDTKINNVLFAHDAPRSLAVIDLDTVMPGVMGHDFGDAIRFVGNTAAEDEPDISKAGLDMDVTRAFAEGFLSQLRDTITPTELDTLYLSPFVMTVECGIRFFADYLEGDPYFKISYPEHNKVRGRCQLALALDMERREAETDRMLHEAAR